MADCSNSPTCQDLTSQKNSGDFTIFGPVFGNINPCCGLFDEASYYSLDSGPCLPCKLIVYFFTIHLSHVAIVAIIIVITIQYPWSLSIQLVITCDKLSMLSIYHSKSLLTLLIHT